MIICVHEIPEDIDPETYFIDLDKFGDTEEEQEYLTTIKEAMEKGKDHTCSAYFIAFEELPEHICVQPPCTVEYFLKIYY